MTPEAEPRVPERTVDVSPAALAQIFPGAGMASPARSASWIRRASSRLRIRLRLRWTRLRFRYDDFRTIRLYVTACRLRAKLAWMRLRYWDRFATRDDDAGVRHSQAVEEDAGRDLLEKTK